MTAGARAAECRTRQRCGLLLAPAAEKPSPPAESRREILGHEPGSTVVVGGAVRARVTGARAGRTRLTVIRTRVTCSGPTVIRTRVTLTARPFPSVTRAALTVRRFSGVTRASRCVTGLRSTVRTNVRSNTAAVSAGTPGRANSRSAGLTSRPRPPAETRIKPSTRCGL